MRKTLELIGFCLGCFAVITQLVLFIQNRQTDMAETLVRFFSFFTILTNSLVTLFFGIKYFKRSQTSSTFWHSGETLTAIATFIIIVGLVYQVVLRSIWEPKGMQLLVDELLHAIIPLFVLVYWLIYATASRIKFKQTVIWLLYPVIYTILVIIRGHFSGFYPYPFVNVSELGITKVILNIGIILLLSLVVMSLLIGVNNQRIKKAYLTL